MILSQKIQPKHFLTKNISSKKPIYLPITRNTLKYMKNAKKTLIESDKAMGDVYINSIELHDAALDILNGPNFERTATPESDISKNVFLNTMQIWKNYKKAIYPHIKKDGIYYKWYSNMKKIEKDKKWLKVPNLCPMIKLHKEEIHWMRFI